MLQKDYDINTPQQQNPEIKVVNIENNMDKQKLENFMINVKVIKKMIQLHSRHFQKIIEKREIRH